MVRFFIYYLTLASCAFAKIPSNDIWGLLEATKPEYRQYSPFWGSAALDGGMLKALRFYGSYTLSTDSQERQIDVAAQDDLIAQLIQNLFPSQDGVSFLPNTWIRESGGFLSRHLESMNDIIGFLISAEADKKSKILDILRPQKEGKLVYGKGIDALSKVNAERFIDVLLKANDYAHNGYNIPYPQHTTIISHSPYLKMKEFVLDEKLLGGIYNWMNVIAKLILGTILAESWGTHQSNWKTKT